MLLPGASEARTIVRPPTLRYRSYFQLLEAISQTLHGEDQFVTFLSVVEAWVLIRQMFEEIKSGVVFSCQWHVLKNGNKSLSVTFFTSF